jgi:hypothetical protein
MAVLLDTSAIAPRDRIAAIHAAMTDATVPHTITHEDPRGDVHARMDYWQLGAANLFRHESSGICHTRTPRQLKIAAPERIALIVHQGGPGTFRGRPRLVLRRRHPLQPAVPRRLRHVAKGRAPAQPAPEPLGRRTSGHSPGQMAGVIEGAEPRGGRRRTVDLAQRRHVQVHPVQRGRRGRSGYSVRCGGAGSAARAGGRGARRSRSGR